MTEYVEFATRSESGLVLGLACGHLVLRHPKWSIPSDLLVECEECAIDYFRRGRYGGRRVETVRVREGLL